MLDKFQMEAVKSSPLFKGLEEKCIEGFLKEVRAFPLRVTKNEILIEQGERRSSIHIVLSGKAVGEMLGSEGRRTIINEFSPGSVFGDMLSGGVKKSPVAVRMLDEGTVLRIPFSSLLTQNQACANTRETVLRNLFNEISAKYFILMRRVNLLLCHTLRGKIALYLLEQAELAGSYSFVSPHTREQQAELLCCDRSALSRELSKLRQEGVIDFSGGKFSIIDINRLGDMSACGN